MTGSTSSPGQDEARPHRRRRPREPAGRPGPGEMFGELSLFDPGPRTATATAVTDADADRARQRRPAAVAHGAPGGRRRTCWRRWPAGCAAPTRRWPTWCSATCPGRVAKALLDLARRFGVTDRGRGPGHARPHPGGARPAGRRLPRDRQQGARRLRRPRLPAPGGPGRRHPRPRAPDPPRRLTADPDRPSHCLARAGGHHTPDACRPAANSCGRSTGRWGVPPPAGAGPTCGSVTPRSRPGSPAGRGPRARRPARAVRRRRRRPGVRPRGGSCHRRPARRAPAPAAGPVGQVGGRPLTRVAAGRPVARAAGSADRPGRGSR